MNYSDFLEQLDILIKTYNKTHKEYIFCKKGCSLCCECGDYPMSQLEFEYIMQGYLTIDNNKQFIIQNNIKRMEKGKTCPFLHKNKCLIYKYRPIICRIHGLAYNNNKHVIVPYCAKNGLNYSSVYKNNYLNIEPIPVNLDTPGVLKGIEYGEIRTMFEWFRANTTKN